MSVRPKLYNIHKLKIRCRKRNSKTQRNLNVIFHNVSTRKVVFSEKTKIISSYTKNKLLSQQLTQHQIKKSRELYNTNSSTIKEECMFNWCFAIKQFCNHGKHNAGSRGSTRRAYWQSIVFTNYATTGHS